METIGSRIKKLRKEKKLTQGKLGDLVGVSDVTIGFWEKDVNEPKYENLEKVIALEGVSVHLYGKQNTKPFRKMGHVTIYGPELAALKTTGRMVAKELKIKA